jgi:hypothetical protein
VYAFYCYSEEEIPRAGFGQQKHKGVYGKRRPLAQSKLSEIDSEIAGMRRRMPGTSSVQQMQKGVGDWERHTKGIGAKLLLQVKQKNKKTKITYFSYFHTNLKHISCNYRWAFNQAEVWEKNYKVYKHLLKLL